ncbi:MAG: peptidylprolyl isomerase [Syntrophaceae bacterium]
MNRTAQQGDTVRVDYTGRYESGEIFDTSSGNEPLEFKLGGEQVIPGFEKAVLGMQTGDKKTVTINPEDGYGEHYDTLVLVMPRENFPGDIAPEIGMQLHLVDENEHAMPVMVTEVTNDTITLDANHPLAGVPLIFEIELKEIVGGLIITP